MDDQRGGPDDPSRYTRVFDVAGQVFMPLDCNRGRSNGSSEPVGQLRFGLLASTNALCHDEGLSERYAAQFETVRSDLLRNGHLYLATVADGAILEFQPASTSDGD